MPLKVSRDNRAILVLFVFLLAITLFRHRHNCTGVISSDVRGYYSYLPALFIQKSFHHVVEGDMNARKNEKGEVVMKYTCGVSYFYLPFFMAIRVADHFGHFPEDGGPGTGPPYQYAVMVSGVVFAMAGIWLLMKLLLRFFSRRATWFTLIVLIFGTNLFHYITVGMGMAHVYALFLNAALILLAHNYYTKPDKRTAIFMGLLLGVQVLMRPTNCVIVLFLVLFNVSSWAALRERLALFRRQWPHLLLMVPFVLLPLIPQLLYWKEMTGHWVTYSYEGEGFIYWKAPKIAAVLLDTQNGLFLYSPALLFMFYGLHAGRKDYRTNVAGTAVIFVVITYIFASWWAWWFGGAFGHRCYIDYLPVLAFPMAMAFEQLELKAKAVRMATVIVSLLFCYYASGLSFLYGLGNIWDGPSWRWNVDTWWNETRKLFTHTGGCESSDTAIKLHPPMDQKVLENQQDITAA